MNITIKQSLRPLKLFFLIKQNHQESYSEAVKLCSSLWGGIFFPILPVYKTFSVKLRKRYHFINSPYDFYKNTIRNFDPDYLVVGKGLNPDFIDKIKGEISSITMDELKKTAIEGKGEYGISTIQILQFLKQAEFAFQRTDNLRMVFPKIGVRNLWARTICGDVHSLFLSKIKDVNLPKGYASFPNLQGINIKKAYHQEIWNYLDITKIKLHTLGNPLWTSQFAVFIINPNSLSDLNDYWNLRALGWNLIPIPPNQLTNPFFRTLIEQQQSEFNSFSRLTNHISVLAFDEQIINIIKKILVELNGIQIDNAKQVVYSHHWWFPRFWSERETLGYDKSAAVLLGSETKKTTVSLSTEDLKIQIPIIKHPFYEAYINHISPRFSNEIVVEFEDIENESKYAQVLPDLKTKDLDFIIRGSGFGQWRFSKGTPIFFVKEQDEHLSFIIPSAKEVFAKWANSFGLEIRNSAAGKLAGELLKSIGGVYGTNFLASQGIPPLLSLFENGKVVLKKTLDSEVNRQLNHFRDKNKGGIINRMLTKRIIEFGCQVQCLFCNQHSFYKLEELNEKLKCPVCHNIYLAPIHKPEDIKWSYRGLGPFSRNNKAEGLLSVLLTLRFFNITMHKSFLTPMLNFELIDHGKVLSEIDLGMFYTRYKPSSLPCDLFLCECKTENDFSNKDIKKMEGLGKRFPGSILTFVTLKSQLSANETTLISKMANKFRKGINKRPICPVLILTKNELMPNNIFNAFENLENKFPNKKYQFPHDINFLCNATCQLYLGLPDYETIVEERIAKKIRAIEKK
jgi:hypothetical protein